MHSSASRATDGTSSVSRACEDPNLRVISEARNELNASAASSGTVIMGSSPYPCSQGLIAHAQAKTVAHAAPLGGCADADAVLPLLPHAKRSPTQAFLSLRQLEARISAHGAAGDL